MSKDIFEIQTKFHASYLPSILAKLFIPNNERSKDSYVSAVLIRDSRPDFRVRDYKQEGEDYTRGTDRQVIATTGKVFNEIFKYIRVQGDWGSKKADHTGTAALCDVMWAVLDFGLVGVTHYPHKKVIQHDETTNVREIRSPDGVMSDTLSRVYPAMEEYKNKKDETHDDFDPYYDLSSLYRAIAEDFDRSGVLTHNDAKLAKKFRSYARQGFGGLQTEEKDKVSSALQYEFLKLRRLYDA